VKVIRSSRRQVKDKVVGEIKDLTLEEEKELQTFRNFLGFVCSSF